MTGTNEDGGSFVWRPNKELDEAADRVIDLIASTLAPSHHHMILPLASGQLLAAYARTVRTEIPVQLASEVSNACEVLAQTLAGILRRNPSDVRTALLSILLTTQPPSDGVVLIERESGQPRKDAS